MSWGKDTRKKLLDEDEDFGEPPISMETGYAKIIVVDNVPIIPEAKYQRLKMVLNKIFSALGTVVQLYFPQESDGSTKGYAFVEYATVEQAQTAIDKINGYELDPSHIFQVTSFDDFQKYINTPDTYQTPTIPPYEPRDNPRWWLLDERGCDQYAVRYSEVTEVLWNDIKPGEPPESVVKREYWSDAYVAWSPQGSYLATMHNEGVALWGGSNWSKVARFPHPGVKLIDFSPCEKYLVTASPQFQDNDNVNDPQCIIVWNTRTGEKLRGFQATSVIGNATWPVFKWSNDDKYFARMTEDTISVYETPGMGLLDKKSIKIPGIKEFAWSPSDPIISYFVPEISNKPASVVLLELPSRKEKRIKNFFSVSDCKLYWQSLGDYLVVKVDKTSKSKKSAYTDFEIFRLREKDIPIDHLEIKEGVTSLAFEPKGTKFAIIHGEGTKPSVSFYSVEGKIQLLKTLEKKSCNSLLWSPEGGFIVLAGLGTLNGVFEFYNAIDMDTIVTEEHMMATQVEWDPTGRYFSTVVSGWKHQLENGYNIYNFQGKLLRHVLQDKFYQLLWRPRPPSLLPADRINYIKKNISQFAREMKAEDRQKEEKEKAKKRAKREAMRQEFESILAQRKKDLEADAALRKELKVDFVDEADYEEREQWVEEVTEVTEIVINED